MKVVILAGGLGTRISEETVSRPKPMVTIGEKPILWHIMSGYAAQGYKEFVIALGYKHEVVKEYFLGFSALNSDLTIDLQTGETQVIGREDPHDWKVTLINTGLNTQTAGRVARVRHVLGDERFMLTYGDGVSDVDLKQLIAKHEEAKVACTVTAVRPPARFGGLEFEGDRVSVFSEKPQSGEGWINGGFFVCEPQVFDFISGDDQSWERGPLEDMAQKGLLGAYKHEGFWQAMDTLRERQLLESLWSEGRAPWKTW